MRTRLLLLVLLLTAVVVPARAGAPGSPAPRPAVEQPVVGVPGSTERVDVGDGRSFVLHVPDRLLGAAPLVVVLHAYSKDAAAMRRLTGLEALADREGFVVAFAEGRDGSWAAGGCCGRARTSGVDDVRYLDAVLGATARRAPVDLARIGLAGLSNGGMMALRYACERSALVASAAVVAGTVVAPCAPGSPVAVLDVHGTADRTVPLEGGTNRALDAVFPAVRPALEPFRAAGGEVDVEAVRGAGHGWLDGASERVWEWVRDHPRTTSPDLPDGP